MTVLKADKLTIVRDGQTVVQDISLELKSGEILGLIGPNGAGKSTTIGGLLGFYPIAAGTVRMGDWVAEKGVDVPTEMKQRMAYIPEQPLYYPDLTLREHLEWKTRLWQSAGVAADQSRLDDLVESFQLSRHLEKFPHQCSKGTLQKLMVVSAFLFPFDVLIVDEPFVGLDVIAIRELKQRIEQARSEGAAVLISTHVLDSAERMCQRFSFLMDGRVFAQGTLEELRGRVTARDPALEAHNSTLEELFTWMFAESRGEAR
jgi:ABC-2 type transport system ATP-binding protein